MLAGVPVLIAEDQTFIALDLSLAVEDAGGDVVGPAASVDEALALLSTRNVGAAILDVDLVGGDCSAVVEILMSRLIPTIIQTGVDLPPALAARFPRLIVHTKPWRASVLVAQLGEMVGDPTAGGPLEPPGAIAE